MAAAAANDNRHVVAVGGEWADAEADLAGGARGIDVEGEDRADAVEGSGGDHAAGAGCRLLGRLEDSPPAERPGGVASRFKLVERKGDVRRNRGVGVVTASVHDAVALAAVGDVVRLVDEEGVDVAAEGDALAGRIDAVIGEDAAAVGAHAEGEAGLIERLVEVEAGLKFGAARFGVRVEAAAQGD
jgi:hypothetical protein